MATTRSIWSSPEPSGGDSAEDGTGRLISVGCSVRIKRSGIFMKHQVLLLLVSAILLGCTSDAGDRYKVDIRWTSYGIPHVRADDWGSLGYGFAYATATDGICVFAREVARANGTLSADFGASDENLAC